jgi:putative transcriptional regulator
MRPETIKIKTGQLLLAEPFMDDPNFKRSVVLLCEHKAEGSLGFIINKCLNMNLGEALPDLKGFESQLYFGGPVETDTLHFLHKLGDRLEGACPVGPDLWWGGDFEMLSILIQTGQVQPDEVRFYLGYSGWSAGQLHSEMEEHSWFVHPGTIDHVFSEDEQLWRQILVAKGGQYRLIGNYPEDPLYN